MKVLSCQRKLASIFMHKHPIKAVLFDLDGTLLNTAPDLTFALNRLRYELNLPYLSVADVVPTISHGAKIMLKLATGIDETSPAYQTTRQRFLELYEQHLAKSTQFFPGMEEVLDYLEQRHIPWGIVTNKVTKFTLILLKALRLEHRPACIVCGDTLPTFKPDPAPIIHACQLLQQKPEDCLYIGDSENDVIASKAAGTRSLVALYGYISNEEDPHAWLADGYIQAPKEIINSLFVDSD